MTSLRIIALAVTALVSLVATTSGANAGAQ